MVAVGLALGLALLGTAGCDNSKSASGGGGGSGGAAVKVGIVYSKTGLLASYGKEYLDGFQAGLAYATKGTGKAGGHKLDVAYADDGGDPAKAVAAAKNLIGKGYKIIGGTTDSGIALQLAPLAKQNKVLYISGPAAADAITGANKYTFRSGRETYQDVITAKSLVGGAQGKKVLVLAQDSAFGKANATAVKAVLGGEGASVSQLLVPLSANDFTPFAAQVSSAKPDLLYVAWAGDTTANIFQTMDQQGIFAKTKVVTGLGDRASYGAYGSAATKITFLSHYFGGAADNAVNKAMTKELAKQGAKPDLFSPDGFVAAQMIVHAVQKANGDASTDKLVSALAGWTFDAPKGSQTIRASDHAMLQPMFVAKLSGSGANLTPSLVKTLPASEVAPPEKQAG